MKLVVGNCLYPNAAMQEAFSSFIAGTAIATDSTRNSYLEIFRGLNSFFARILKQLMNEISAKKVWSIYRC
jgi:hypothetical protein